MGGGGKMAINFWKWTQTIITVLIDTFASHFQLRFRFPESLAAFIKGCNFKTAAAAAKSLQSCLTLWDPIDGSPPGSPVPGILQARVLEWGAIAFSIF